LNKLWRHVDLERTDLNRFIYHELQEELVDSLEVWPSRVHLFFLINSSLRETKIGLLDVWKRSEDVFLDHLHNFVEVGNDHTDDVFLVLKHLLELLNSIESLSLALDILGLVLVIIVLHAELKLLDERFL